MRSQGLTRPDFLVIGAQKAGTSWLWQMLEQHPDADLPARKEIHFFGGVENYRKGKEWYYNHFKEINPSKITGEASTSYFYDHIPYWYNPSRSLEHDRSLPTIPELIMNELPDAKIILILRDPVRRAVSAYKHLTRHAMVSPRLGLKQTALNHPKTRILEYGLYAKYLTAWKALVAPDRMRIFVFEEDVRKSPENTVREIYEFLALDSGFKPQGLSEIVHKSWTWTRIFIHYYSPKPLRRLIKSRFGNVLDSVQLFPPTRISRDDLDFLHTVYSPQKRELEALLKRKLDCWNHESS